MPQTPGHRELTADQVERIRVIKNAGAVLLAVLDAQSAAREVSLAKPKVEEAVMWAVEGVTG